MLKKKISILVSIVLLFVMGGCHGATTEVSSENTPLSGLIDPESVIFEPLYQETLFTSGKINVETGAIEENESYGYILNYPVKKGRVLSISNQKFPFSIIKYNNGSYSEVVKESSIKNYTVTEDMNIAIQIFKSNQSPITDDELSKVVIRDTLFRMTDLDGNIHRFTVEAETINGETKSTRAALFIPVSYSETGNPNKLILMTNGHSAYLSDSSWYSDSDDNTALIKTYLSEGYAVFVVDNTSAVEGKSSDMGCPQLVSSYFKAYEYIQQNFNVEKQIYMHSRSFGTFAALRIMREHPELIKCGLMTGPRVSMQKEWDENRPDKDVVADRFGFNDRSGKTYEADKLIGHDPYTDIESGSYPLPPTFWVMAVGDMTERPEEFIEELKMLGNNVSSSTYPGTNHSGICALNIKGAMADALAFFREH